MRNKKRIPIILNYFFKNVDKLAEFCNINLLETANILNNWKDIEELWLENPDLRFGQLLINKNLLDSQNECWAKEEDDWLIEKGYLKIEDIKFWGRNLDKDNNILPKTEFILLKDLRTEHIKAIIKFVKNKNRSINFDYLKYFKIRLKK